MTLLIDGDWLGYKICSSCETETRWTEWCHTLSVNPIEAKARASDQVESWMRMTGHTEVRMCFSSNPTFRHEIYQDYKANRVAKRKPMALREVYDFLGKAYCGVTYTGLEADDTMGLLATCNAVDDPIIVSPDKDMRTIAGKLMANDQVQLITKDEADRNWMMQVLTGDKVDNIQGIAGVGPKTADKILGSACTLKDMWPIVVGTYQKKGRTFSDALLNARLCRILRRGDYDLQREKLSLWHPSSEKDLAEASANAA